MATITGPGLDPEFALELQQQQNFLGNLSSASVAMLASVERVRAREAEIAWQAARQAKDGKRPWDY